MKRYINNILTKILTLTLLLLAGANVAWGQTDLSGVYYIGSKDWKLANTSTNYYLCPTEGWCYYKATDDFTSTDNGQPFITTYQCRNGVYEANKAVWIIEKHPSEDYYYIKHAIDGKYLVFNGQIRTTSNSDRMRVHLESMTSPGDNTLFSITANGTGYNIKPKDFEKHLTVNDGNKPALTGQSGKSGGPTGYQNTSGIVGTYESITVTSYFYLEETVMLPTFTIDASGVVSISSVEGTSIRYTTDGTTDPTASSGESYNGTITPAEGMTAIKAIAVRGSDNKVSAVVTLPLADYTYNIVDTHGNIAIMHTVKQAVGKALNNYMDIPTAIRSPYLDGETISFYTSATQLDDENEITKTPAYPGNIYVTYSTNHLTEKFLHLTEASAYNIKVNSDYIYDNNGTLAYENAPQTTKPHMWQMIGGDPYAVQIKNADTGNYLHYNSPIDLSNSAFNFILMACSTADDDSYEQMELMAATGNDSYNRIEQVRAYPIDFVVNYYLIDKAGKLIEGPINSTAEELSLPDEWKSPLVSEYHYFKESGQSGDTYAPSNPVSNIFDVESGGRIYVTYDVSDAIDLTGGKTYMLKFSDGVSFNQEDGSDGIIATSYKAVYPYNNGEFHLYVYGQEQWEKQLSSGASTRTRWLWHILSGNSDPYHVIFKSEQNQTVKDKKEGEDYNFPGNTYLRTYKPTGYESVVTDVAYESEEYHTAYSAKMPSRWVNGGATEYMIIGTSILNMKLKTFDDVDGARQVVTSFEQYWKNNPTANNLLVAGGLEKVTGNEESVSLDANQRSFLEGANTSLNKAAWHSYNVWAYTKPWEKYANGSTDKALKEGEHWLQTISMGTGNFTLEEMSLVPQVILLDQHGWEIMRVPMYSDNACTVINTDALNMYNSPMVDTYHWYPKATKATGYHKYKVKDSDKEIIIYQKNDKNKWVDSGQRYTHTSSSLNDIPYNYITTPEQDKSVKTDFYVTYDVKPEYKNSYTGAAKKEDTATIPFLLKQGGSYATTADGTTITTTTAPASLDNADEEMQWNLRPNFDIDHEMGYKYAGETGAYSDAKSKNETEADYVANGQNGFDPYNLQIQNKKYSLRFFTTDTRGSALSNGAWTSTSGATVTLQNQSTKQTATGYDQTTLNITNATFMAVDDGNGNMRLMPRFDHQNVVTSFTTLATQTAAATAGDDGAGTQSFATTSTPRLIHSTSEITSLGGHYILAENFTISNGFTSLGSSTAPFTGSIDGQLNTITGLKVPLVAYAQDATIKNVILKGVAIESGDTDGDAGAICCKAKGETRIYNCGILDGSVSGTRYVGGLVGLLDHEGEANKGSRVVNCFSYADVGGGTEVGGIVGYNSYKSKHNDIRTMVMNCMFYGDITSGTSIAPIYGGEIIDNAKSNSNYGLNNYNYYRYESNYSKNNQISSDRYNCALAAEEKYLVHFEFYRLLLNSNKKLAAYYASRSSSSVNPSDMAKWVLESADRTNKNPKPYPVLKQQGEYYSIINYDDENVKDLTSSLVNNKPKEEDRNKGSKLGSLNVTISDNTSGKGSRTGSFITTGSKTLPITDKDFDKYNYNYYKVRLPYYNEVGKDNYKDGKVVTGWIIEMTGATQASNGEDITTTGGVKTIPYNFAERTCTKDENGDYRVFSQGAYFDVPIGVSDITIKPYWANAAFISDKNLDKTYTSGFGAGADVAGSQYTSSDTPYEINGINIKVRNDFTTALSDITTKGSSVYDNAIVLVGNVHQGAVPYNTKTVPFTIMSADFDNDNEPDFSMIYHHYDRKEVSPIRFDFINILGTSMAQKPNGSLSMWGVGIFKPYGWFEVTNTTLISFGQIEYDFSGKSSAPLILLGGEVLQIVSNNSNNNGVANCTNNTKYIHIGSNVWFKEFNNGIHSDKQNGTPHRPISVTGGRYEKFYLSGIYQPTIKYNFFSDDAECYINGGSFGEVAGAGQEKIDGDVNWIIDYADIDNFYGGGINAANAITGDINVTIKNSHVDVYCGGPKFGNMGGYNTSNNPDDDKTVTTNAEDCVFRRFFGAGYGGASYNRVIEKTQETTTPAWSTWDDEYTNRLGIYLSDRKGIATGFEYEYFIGSKGTIWGRFYVNYASFSKAITNNVNSTLKNCHITGDFYGGGSLGVVSGTAYSTLDGCTVDGSVFGGGYSGSIPTIDVVSSGFTTNPGYDSKAGIFTPAVLSDSVSYKWDNVASLSNNQVYINPSPPNTASTNNIIKTDQDLTNLGQVNNVDLTIKGNTYVKGDIHKYDEKGKIITAQTVTDIGGVFGGGDESTVNGNTIVKVEGTSTTETQKGVMNVYGGGNTAEVKGDASVTLQGTSVVRGDVFGGGNRGDVKGSSTVSIEQ